MPFAPSVRAALLACALVAAGAAGAQPGTPSVRMVVQSSPLAGFRYHEAGSLWNDLRPGDALELVREPGNLHDPRAVRVEWRGRMLGYVPRRENDAVAWGLDRGDALRARISRLDPTRPPSRRVEFEVYVD
jgi:hypothetical protein